MHQPIKDSLEEYLSGMVDTATEKAIEEHLASCEHCRQAVAAMRGQSKLLKVLCAGEEADAAPGFYARVMDRIEAGRIPSIWELLLEPVCISKPFLTLSYALFDARILPVQLST